MNSGAYEPIIEVNRTRCEGHAQCVAAAPNVFNIDGHGELTVANGGTAIPVDELDDLMLAVSACPMNALRLVNAHARATPRPTSTSE